MITQFISPSQVLIENQDANVDELIHMTQVTAARIRKNRKNNFGLPRNVNWKNLFSSNSESRIQYHQNLNQRVKNQGEKSKFDLDLFFNELKWHNYNSHNRLRNLPEANNPDEEFIEQGEPFRN